MAPMGTLNWVAAALLGLGLAAAGLSLLRGKAPALSGLLAALFCAGLWGLFGLPTLQAPFAVLAAGTLAGGLCAVLGRSSRASVLGALLCLASLAGLFLLLGFPYLAAAHVLVHISTLGLLLLLALPALGPDEPEPDGPGAAFSPGLLAGPILAGALAGKAVVGVLAAGRIENAADPAALSIRQPQAAATVEGGGVLGHLLFGSHHPSGEAASGPAGLRKVVHFQHFLSVQAAGLLVLAALLGGAALLRGGRAASAARE